MIDTAGINLSRKLLKQDGFTITEKVFYAYLFSECGAVDRFCEKSLEELIAELNLSQRTIFRMFTRLTELELFDIKKGRGKDLKYLFIAKKKIG